MTKYDIDSSGCMIVDENGHIKHLCNQNEKWHEVFSFTGRTKELEIPFDNAAEFALYIEINNGESKVNTPHLYCGNVTSYDFLGAPAAAFTTLKTVGDMKVLHNCVRGSFSNTTVAANPAGSNTVINKALYNAPDTGKFTFKLATEAAVTIKVWKE